ncbi:MAG: anti-sigma factor [Ferruginibacter sp.]|nr:anti-sigma factor [Ferruginibacter sp.]
MKTNQDLDELLTSYITKELTSDEALCVIELLQNDEKARQQYELLQNTWRLLAIEEELSHVDVNNEWKQFEQNISKEKQQLFPVRNINDTEMPVPEDKKSISNFRRLTIALAVAASLLVLITFQGNKSSGSQENIEAVAAKMKEGVETKVFVRHEANVSGESKEILLQDGSEIILADKSEVSFEEPFSDNRRDITLNGKADFKVAKDKSRPFTVFSLGLATTALGTRFTVTAFENSNSISVRLHEGKVVVKPTGSARAITDSSFYLRPGEELIYNRKNYTAKLINFKTKEQELKESNVKMLAKDDPMLPENIKGSWYMFNNQSLEQVFEQLKLSYNVEIKYSKKDISNIYFIGKFEKTDSIYSILNQVASVNNLKVVKKDNGFLITK